MKGASCKYCKAQFLQKISTNLKRHLKANHPETFEKVIHQDKEKYAFVVVGEDIEKKEGVYNNGLENKRKVRRQMFGKDEFDKVDDSYGTKGANVKCKHCSKVIVKTSIKSHLKLQHRELYNKLQTKYRENRGFNQKIKYPKNAQFQCQKCIYSTNFQGKFDAHLFDEHLETSCQYCGTSFTHFNEYYNHLLTHVAPINCDVCDRQYLDQERFDYHLKMGHRDEPGNGFCPTCGVYCRVLSLHNQHVHNNKQSPCPQCDFVPKNEFQLRRHLSKVHTSNNHVPCPWCGSVTKDLERHLKSMQCNVPEEERVFKPNVKCKYCDKEFKQGKIKQHMRQVHELVMKYCDQCDYKTPVAGNLRLHIKRKHEGKPLKEECQVCHKMCVSIQGHMKIYHGDLVNRTK